MARSEADGLELVYRASVSHVDSGLRGWDSRVSADRVVHTAVNSTSELACNAGRWERADQVPVTLAPINPSRILSAISLPPCA